MSSYEPLPDYSSRGNGSSRNRRWKGPLRIVAILGVVAILAFAVFSQSNVFRDPSTIHIENIGTFEITPENMETVRSDVFAKGHFSVFDVLVYLDKKGDIDLVYHWDGSMNTHVIDSINGKVNWWYKAYYDGGWLEENNFRMDLYPYKDLMFIQVRRVNPGLIDIIHDTYREEVQRLEANGGQVIIPKVTITGPGLAHVFEDVVVTPHNLRNDTLKKDTITAIDVILSLSDQGEIDHDLQWYEEIAGSQVKTYFVVGIDGQKAYGRCGFVYEEGDSDHKIGNHIHIPSDIRVLTSPEYEKWFWICV